MKICETDRERDERDLHWVKLRCNGIPVKDIAKRYGTAQSYVSGRVNAIKDADILTATDAEGAYW